MLSRPITKAAKIGISWSVIAALGIYGFVLSKNVIIDRRYESMKVRERMRKANDGEYEPSSRRFS